MTNLIEEYINIIKEYTDSPKIFQQASGYFLTSTLLGQYFNIQWLHKGRPNVWFILSSIPGRMRRSTIQDFNDCVLFTSLTEGYKQIQKANDATRIANPNAPKLTEAERERKLKDEANTMYMNSIIEDGSYEGIQDRIITGVESGVTNFSINSTEFGNTLKKITGSGYRSGTDTLFSKLYSGERSIQSFSQRGRQNPELSTRYIPEGLYVTMFAGMQEPGQYLSEGLSRQGLLRRIMVAYVKPGDLSMDDWKSPLREKNSEVYRRLREFSINNIVPLIVKYNKAVEENKGLLWVDIETFVREKLENQARKIDKALTENVSDYDIYRQTYWEHLTKLSTLNAIAMDKTIGTGVDTMLMVDREAARPAFKFLKTMTKHTESMMEEISARKVARKIDTTIDFIYTKIKNTGPKGISHSKLLTGTSLKTEKLGGYIITLVDAERIVVVSEKTKGRPKTVYVATCFLKQ